MKESNQDFGSNGILDFFCLGVSLRLELRRLSWYSRSSLRYSSIHFVLILSGLYHGSPPRRVAVLFMWYFPSGMIYISRVVLLKTLFSSMCAYMVDLIAKTNQSRFWVNGGTC